MSGEGKEQMKRRAERAYQFEFRLSDDEDATPDRTETFAGVNLQAAKQKLWVEYPQAIIKRGWLVR